MKSVCDAPWPSSCIKKWRFTIFLIGGFFSSPSVCVGGCLTAVGLLAFLYSTKWKCLGHLYTHAHTQSNGRTQIFSTVWSFWMNHSFFSLHTLLLCCQQDLINHCTRGGHTRFSSWRSCWFDNIPLCLITIVSLLYSLCCAYRVFFYFIAKIPIVTRTYMGLVVWPKQKSHGFLLYILYVCVCINIYSVYIKFMVYFLVA